MNCALQNPSNQALRKKICIYWLVISLLSSAYLSIAFLSRDKNGSSQTITKFTACSEEPAYCIAYSHTVSWTTRLIIYRL